MTNDTLISGGGEDRWSGEGGADWYLTTSIGLERLGGSSEGNQSPSSLLILQLENLCRNYDNWGFGDSILWLISSGLLEHEAWALESSYGSNSTRKLIRGGGLGLHYAYKHRTIIGCWGIQWCRARSLRLYNSGWPTIQMMWQDVEWGLSDYAIVCDLLYIQCTMIRA